MNFQSSQSYDGKGQTLGGRPVLTGLHDVDISNFNFADGLVLNGCSKVRLWGCTLHGAGFALEFNGLSDSVIAGNTFSAGDSGIFGKGSTRNLFAFNDCRGVGDGIHVWYHDGTDPHAAAGGHNRVWHNLIDGYSRYALEQQGQAVALDIGWNYAQNKQGTPGFGAYSIATGGWPPEWGGDPNHWKASPPNTSYGVVLHDCVAVLRPGDYNPIEAMGWDIEVRNCWLRNGHHAILYGLTTPRWSYHDNVAVDLAVWAEGEPPLASEPDPANVRNNRMFRSGDPGIPAFPTIASLMAGRAYFPGIDKVGGIIVPPPPPNPVPPPTNVATSPDPANNGRLVVTWQQSDPTARPHVRVRASDPGDAADLGLLPAGTTQVVIGGIPDHWQVQVSVSLVTAQGESDPVDAQPAMPQVFGGPSAWGAVALANLPPNPSTTKPSPADLDAIQRVLNWLRAQ